MRAARPWPGSSPEIAALSTGFSEAVELAKAGEVEIIGVTSQARVDAYADAPTMNEQGIDAAFIDWRGFCAAPGLPADRLAAYQEAIARMYDTPEWEEVRARNGWVDTHNPGDAFRSFLEGQEKVIGGLMKKLGFLRSGSEALDDTTGRSPRRRSDGRRGAS